MTTPTLLVMAGGTGGHIMPGLAVAQELKRRGWNIAWLGNPERMEGHLVPSYGFELHALDFGGVRGKGPLALLKLPFALLRAGWQAHRIFRRVRPDVVLGMGGYVAFPGGLVSRLHRVPLVIHEQNAVAGTANRWLARMADKVMTGFPGALPGAVVVGNPVRADIAHLAQPEARYGAREGRLRVLVLGGSLGALPLNTTVPLGMKQLPENQRPEIWHQSGEQHLDTLRTAYANAGVDARCVAFIDDMAQALAWADLVICRAGAMTVSEIAAAGVAALFVPLPHAIDDHQTANARFLSECDGAWLQPQAGFTPEWLAQWLSERERDELARVGQHAWQHARPEATEHIADACVQAAGRAS
ncbi:MAG TPA: undecaprenyldiphospho-muramoylpentapeptide beta-N-acetylglucosaminyltransferase [Burkholderiaceae bacterium]|nr:undecaprenyldiphospho-muramoylpentapeptide beta-N-acetylglucosaminyltransferase [Burkholderiaceae bacterium]